MTIEDVDMILKIKRFLCFLLGHKYSEQHYDGEKELDHEVKIGAYVLATKYHDGDPCDHFCVGFVSEINGDRYIVVDSEGRSFRANGFRRVKVITGEEGTRLLNIFPKIGNIRGSSLWGHLDRIRNRV